MIFDTEILTDTMSKYPENIAKLARKRLSYQAPHIDIFSYKTIHGQGGSLFEDQSGAAHS